MSFAQLIPQICEEEIDLILKDFDGYLLICLTKSYHIKIYHPHFISCSSHQYNCIINFVKNNAPLIPIPQIISYGTINTIQYIISKRIDGETPDILSDNMISQLRQYKSQLASIKVSEMGTPGENGEIVPKFLCGYIGEYENDVKLLMDARISKSLSAMKKILGEDSTNTWRDIFSYFDISNTTINFQHCDWHMQNILVKNDNVVSIVDWELAGVYPSHYTDAKMVHMKCNFDYEPSTIILLEQIILNFSTVYGMEDDISPLSKNICALCSQETLKEIQPRLSLIQKLKIILWQNLRYLVRSVGLV